MQQRQQVPVSLDQTTGVICGNCQNNTFNEVFLLRKVSRFVVQAAEDVVMPIPVFVCAKCGTITEDAIQFKEVKELLNKTIDVSI